MSIALTKLVNNARPFCEGKRAPYLRSIMRVLVGAVNQREHVNWCFPSLETLEECTDISRSTLIECITQLKDAGWFKVEPRKGYGNAYIFDVAKLEESQRPDKVYPSAHRTRLYTGPVRLGRLTRPVGEVDPSGWGDPNIEEQESIKKEQEPLVADATVTDSTDPQKPVKPTTPKPVLVKGRANLIPPISDDDVERVRMAYPRRDKPDLTRKAIRAAHGRLMKGQRQANGTAIGPLSAAEATEYLFDQTSAMAKHPETAQQMRKDKGQFLSRPATWFNGGGYLETWVTRKPMADDDLSASEMARKQLLA